MSAILPAYSVRVLILTPSRNELVYARLGLHLVRFDRDLDGSGGEKVVAGLDRRGRQQRHHLLDRDADRRRFALVAPGALAGSPVVGRVLRSPRHDGPPALRRHPPTP